MGYLVFNIHQLNKERKIAKLLDLISKNDIIILERKGFASFI